MVESSRIETAGAVAANAASAVGMGPAPRRIGTGYSQFVGLMKLVLPIIAAILIALVVIWPKLQPIEEGFRIGISSISPEEAENLYMMNARYMGLDERNQPFMITAEAATQANPESDLVVLELPKADIILADGVWLALAAESGAFHRTDQTLDLLGSVNIFHDAGYEFRTLSAHVDLSAGTAQGNDPVVGQGPFGILRAEGFRLFDRGARILFTGKARLVLYPGFEQLDR